MRTLSYLSLFLLVFDLAIPSVKFIGSAPFSLLISLSVLFIGNGKLNIEAQVKYFTAPFFVFYFVIICFALFRISFSGELNYLLSISKSLVIFSATTFYLLAFGCERINDKLINIFFINGVICLIAGSIPAILEWVYFFKSGVAEQGFIPYRNAFLAGSGYFGMASAYAVIILLCAHKLVKDGLSVNFAIKFMVILVAGVLAGRTAFVGVAISFVYIMSQSVKYSGLGVLLVAGLVAIILSVDALSVYAGWMFEFISFDGDSVALSRTSSTDELDKMYFMPAHDSTWLWGDGRYVDGEGYYMHTDAGYMRNLFFGGLPFVIAVIAYACLFAFKSKSVFFTLFILPLAFALHYKGAFILNNPASVPMLTLLAFWFYHERINKKCNAGIVQAAGRSCI
ncbi:hypothetical protein BM607_012885 [Shewanella sp. SACH]|uniref:hypothetical protein n=1 Tax=Shewanella sp. SACH TaxID=1873135 RepID=UPI000903D5DA|nr:hypothetical protein [Shewanella sp. SACH]OUS52102.1 hypothetical protein BM607_012885 [Shewanella sp. SACH]